MHVKLQGGFISGECNYPISLGQLGQQPCSGRISPGITNDHEWSGPGFMSGLRDANISGRVPPSSPPAGRTWGGKQILDGVLDPLCPHPAIPPLSTRRVAPGLFRWRGKDGEGSICCCKEAVGSYGTHQGRKQHAANPIQPLGSLETAAGVALQGLPSPKCRGCLEGDANLSRAISRIELE